MEEKKLHDNGLSEEPMIDWLDEKNKIIEGAFAEYYIKKHPMICIHEKLFTFDGIISDESGIKNDIYFMIRPYVTSGL